MNTNVVPVRANCGSAGAFFGNGLKVCSFFCVTAGFTTSGTASFPPKKPAASMSPAVFFFFGGFFSSTGGGMVAPISTSESESSFSSVKPSTSAALRFFGFSSKWALVAALAGDLAFGGLLAFGGDLAARGAFAGDGFGDAGLGGAAASGETLGAAAGALGFCVAGGGAAAGAFAGFLAKKLRMSMAARAR